MKGRCKLVAFALIAFQIVTAVIPVAGSAGEAVSSVVQMIPAAVDMKETEGPGNLYALSAVLMDGDSGRVLYECPSVPKCRLPARGKTEFERRRAVLLRRSSLFFNAEKPQ